MSCVLTKIHASTEYTTAVSIVLMCPLPSLSPPPSPPSPSPPVLQGITKALFRNLKESKRGLLQFLVKQYARVLLHWSVRPFVVSPTGSNCGWLLQQPLVTVTTFGVVTLTIPSLHR